jgi:hypothetical protein
MEEIDYNHVCTRRLSRSIFVFCERTTDQMFMFESSGLKWELLEPLRLLELTCLK